MSTTAAPVPAMWTPSPRLLKVIVKVHVPLYRLTGGLVGGRGRGVPHLLLTTLGAKSGLKRVIPLPFATVNGLRYVAASNNLAEHNPAWWHNLVATPNVTVQVRRHTHAVTASTLDSADRARLWPEVAAQLPWLDGYQAQIARNIPIVQLEPTLDGATQ